jgi:hypothetical protein
MLVAISLLNWRGPEGLAGCRKQGFPKPDSKYDAI